MTKLMKSLGAVGSSGKIVRSAKGPSSAKYQIKTKARLMHKTDGQKIIAKDQYNYQIPSSLNFYTL